MSHHQHDPLRAPLHSLAVDLMRVVSSIDGTLSSMEPIRSRVSADLSIRAKQALDRYKSVRFDGEVQSIMARQGLVG